MVGPNDIGDVYIDVHADTKGLSREIRAAAALAGRDFGDEFNSSLGSELDKGFAKVGKDIRKNLEVEGVRSGEGFSDRMKSTVERRIRQWDIDISEGVVFGDWSRALDQFDDISDGVEKVQTRLKDLNKTENLTDEQFRDATESLSKYVRSIEESVEAEEKAATARARATGKMRAQREAVDGLLSSMRSLRHEIDGAGTISIATDDDLKRLKNVETDLKSAAVAVKNYNREQDNTISIFGRLKGSRNDALNLFGSIAKTIEDLPQKLISLGRGFSKVGAGMEEAAEAGGGIKSLLTGLSVGLRTIGASVGRFASKSLPGLAAAMIVIGKTMTSLFAGMSSLLGIVTALAAALTDALGAALLAVGPMLGSVAVGVLALVAAFSTMSKKTTKQLEGLKDTWTDFGQAVGKNLFAGLPDLIGKIGDAFEKLTPLVSETATVLNGWATNFVDTLNSAQFGKTLDIFETTWPSILRNLSSAFTSTFTGLTGVLAAISPSVEKISDGISAAANHFSDWANSAGGQNAISKWFDSAWESARKLGSILGNLVKGIGGVFGAGKDTGDDLLGSLDDITQRFSDWANSKEGQAQIKQWFEDAKDLAVAIGTAVSKVAKELDKWDTKENRADFVAIVSAVGTIAADALKVANWLSKAFDWARKLGQTLTPGGKDGFGFNGFDYGNSKLGKFLNKYSGGKGWSNLEKSFTSLGDTISGAFTGAGDAIVKFLDPLNDWDPGPAIGDFFSNIGTWISDIDWSGLGKGLKSAIETLDPGKWLSDLFDKIDWSGLGDLAQDIWDGIVEGFETVTFNVGKFVDAVIDALKAAFGISSPATTMIPIGADLAAGIIKGLIDNIGKGLGALASTLISGLTSLVSTVLSAVGQTVSGVGGIVSQAWTTAQTATSNALTSIKNTAITIWNSISTTVGSIVQGIATKIGDAWTAAKDNVTDAVDKIQSAVSTGWTNAKNAVTRLVTGIGTSVKTGFTNQVNNVKRAMTNIGTAISNGWQSAKTTVSQKLSSIVQNVTSGFNQQKTKVSNSMSDIKSNIGTNWAAAETRTRTAMNTIVSTVRDGMNSAVSAVRDGMSKIAGEIRSGMNSAVSEAQAGMNSLVSAIRSGISDASSAMSDLGSALVGAASGLEDRMYSAGVSIASALVSGIRSQAGAAAAAVENEMASARALIPDSPAKKGPFSGRGWVTYSGAAIIDGLVEGIQSRSGALDVALSKSLAGAHGALGTDLLAGNRSQVPWAGPYPAGGAAGGGGGVSRTLSVAQGAIVVNAPQADAGLVASKVLDKLVRQTVS